MLVRGERFVIGEFVRTSGFVIVFSDILGINIDKFWFCSNSVSLFKLPLQRHLGRHLLHLSYHPSVYLFTRIASLVQRNLFVYEHQNNYIYFYQGLNEFN